MSSLFVARDVGAAIGSQAKRRLPAKVDTVETRNLVGINSVASDELTVIHSHTDGTADKVDYDLMRRESISFTQMLLDLSRVPASALK